MSTVNNNFSKNINLKNTIEIMNKKAKELFRTLCNELEPGSKEIDLDKLRNIISVTSKKANYKSEIIDIITKYKLNDMIIGGKIQDKNYNLKINEKDFCEFVTGQNIKNTLFEKNLVDKRKNVEELKLIFNLLGGNSEGISKANLNKNISKVMKLMNEPNTYLRDDFNPETVSNDYDNEAQQIINLLGNSNENKLSLQDFINAMTCEHNTDFNNFQFEN